MNTTNYLNLDLVFHNDGDSYWVRARNSLGIETTQTQPFDIPLTDQERQALDSETVYPVYLNPQSIGQHLYDELFQGEVRDLLIRSQEQAREMTGLRLRLHLNETPELGQLPWEYLYDAIQARFLALTARLSIVRYLELGETPQTLRVEPPLRVLVVLANPVDLALSPLDVETEWERLQEALRDLVDRDIVDLVRLEPPTRRALEDYLEQHPVHVLHFVGHGDYNSTSEDGGLWLEDDAGTADFVPAPILQVLLADSLHGRSSLRLVFLNACFTGRNTQIDPFVGTAQRLVQQGVPAVIAMQFAVTDTVATELAHRFYRVLARGYSVDAALAQARKGVYIQENYLEWGTPVLFLRAPDGQLFDVVGAEKLIPLPPDVACPYRGLEVFEVEHAPFYFGRDDMVQRLLAKVAATNFIAIVGASGSGKSSLVRAGLIPALASGAPTCDVLTGTEKWQVDVLRPGSDPLRACISTLLQRADPDTRYATRIGEVRRLANMLRAGELPLADLLDPLRGRQPFLILIIDQFEEAFTLCDDDELRRTFFATLLEMTKKGWLKIILTLRADFWGHMLEEEAFGDQTLGQRADAGLVNVLVMTRNERRAAIEKPAHVVGRHFSEGLVDRILDDVADEPGQLPLLEFALTELWTHQRADGTLTHDAYDAIGRVSGAIAQRADATLATIDHTQHTTVRTIMTRLVRVARPDEGVDTKRRIAFDELDEQAQALVQRLASDRLLVTGADSETGVRFVEIAHEALIGSWQQLGEWLDGDRQFLLWRQSLRTQVANWLESKQDAAALLRGSFLTEAERWATNRIADLNDWEYTFIQASSAATEAEEWAKEAAHRRNFRRLVAFSIVALLLAAAASFFGFRSNYNFNQAETRRLEAETRQVQAEAAATEAFAAKEMAQAAEATTEASLINSEVALINSEVQGRRTKANALAGYAQIELFEPTDPSGSLALLLAKEAILTTLSIDGMVTVSAYTTLFRATDTATPHRLSLPRGRHTGQVNSVAFSPDGATLVSAGNDNMVRLWDVSSGQELQTFRGHIDEHLTNPGLRTAAFSPDGAAVVSAGHGGTVRLWDVSSGQELQTFRGHTSAVNSAAFSPDGATIVSGDYGGTVRLWDVSSGQELQTFEGNSYAVYSVAFSPDGATIASDGDDGTVRLWDVSSGRKRRIIHGHTGLVGSVAFSPDGATIASTDWDGTVRLWDVSSGQELQTFQGHTGWVKSVAFSPDGATIVSGSEDGTMRLWDVFSGQELQTLQAHTGGVESVAFSPDGVTIVSAGGSMVLLWDVFSGRQIQGSHNHTERIRSVAFSPDGTTIVFAGEDNAVRLWDVSSGQELQTFQDHTQWVNSVAFSPDGATIVSASQDQTVRLWDVSSGQELQTFKGHTNSVFSAAFSPNGATIVSASGDRTVRLWDVSSGQEIQTFKGHTDMVFSAAFSPNGATIVSAGNDLTVRLWDVSSGQKLQTFQGHTDSVFSATFNPRGATIASASADGTVRLWNVSSGQEIWRDWAGWNKKVFSATFSPDGATIVSGGDNGTVYLWDVSSGQEIQTAFWDSPDDSVNSATFSPDGATIVSAGSDGTVRLWDVSSGLKLQTFRGHTQWVNSVAFSPDGATIVSAGGDRTVRLWDVSSGQELQTFRGHSYWVESAAFTPDGTTIVSASADNTVRLWDVSSSQELQTLQGHGNTDKVALSPDGATIVSANSYQGLWLWDVPSGQKLQTIGYPGWVNSAAFSPDGATIVSAGNDDVVRLWDVSSGQEIQTFLGHTAIVLSVAFSPDGATIASAGVDRTVRLWDVSSGQEIQTFLGHTDSINSVAFSPDGAAIVSASNDGTVRLWPASIDALLALAEAMIQRKSPILTPVERQLFGISKPVNWHPPALPTLRIKPTLTPTSITPPSTATPIAPSLLFESPLPSPTLPTLPLLTPSPSRP